MKLMSSSTSVPLSNRGIAYGDGFFETILFRKGKSPLLKHHMARLCNTANALGMSISQSDVTELVKHLKANIIDSATDQVVKLLVTREAGGRGYRPLPTADTEVYIQAFEYSSVVSDSILEQGVVLRVCDIKLANQPALAGLKHLNRLENVLARNEWHDDAFYEGLLLDQTGLIIEATQSNVFFKIGQRWLTPELNRCGVAGVMRAWLLAHEPELQTEFHITTLSLDDLSKATSCFICNSVQGIVPVQSIQLKESRVAFDVKESLLLLKQVGSVLG